jgi:hypothetical protein
MWIERTAEEVTKWNTVAQREARRHGLLMGASVGFFVSVLASCGWFFSMQGVVQHSVTGSVLVRLPIFAVLVLPFSVWIYRRESHKEMTKASRRTICPKCDTAGEGNAGATCQCGGVFVPQSTMKWVER